MTTQHPFTEESKQPTAQNALHIPAQRKRLNLALHYLSNVNCVMARLTLVEALEREQSLEDEPAFTISRCINWLDNGGNEGRLQALFLLSKYLARI